MCEEICRHSMCHFKIDLLEANREQGTLRNKLNGVWSHMDITHQLLILLPCFVVFAHNLSVLGFLFSRGTFFQPKMVYLYSFLRDGLLRHSFKR